MKQGDRVKHKIKGWVGLIHSIEKHGVLVNWSDDHGIKFRLASLDSLEIFDDPEV